ncbi:uncharacterized protein N7459_003351 [Penicillium hispanicum]|uniref:uncharacterized protein n=1 Tax=Penicillium hispanicum TaxID=1080232 RepID=UPI00253FB3B0|nr:uncharacterized protein N7459_003351 [Penicillium hispanicum]KAJ5587586.1 hypothetical protein N7459_003351 [Penicillium hispanicum]
MHSSYLSLAILAVGATAAPNYPKPDADEDSFNSFPFMASGSSSMDDEDDGLENPVPVAMEAMIAAQSSQAYSYAPPQPAPTHAVVATPAIQNFPAPTSDLDVEPSTPAFLSFPATPSIPDVAEQYTPVPKSTTLSIPDFLAQYTPPAAKSATPEALPSSKSVSSAEATPHIPEAVRNLVPEIPKPIAPSPTSIPEDYDGAESPSLPMDSEYDAPAAPVAPSHSAKHIFMQSSTHMAFYAYATPISFSSKARPTGRPTPAFSRHHTTPSSSATPSATPTPKAKSKSGPLGTLTSLLGGLPLIGGALR